MDFYTAMQIDDDITGSSSSCDALPPYSSSSGYASASSLSQHQWSDIVQYLDASELKALRLAGNREMYLSDPSLTCHLQLRMDLVPFFSASSAFDPDEARRWLTNRRRLVINSDATTRMCPHRVAHLVSNGYLDSVSEIVILDCHAYRSIFTILARLPNLKSLKLASHASEQEERVVDELECIVSSLGNIPTLNHLDVEFDCVVHGSRLSALPNLQGLKHLRLRGFDLSDGLHSIGALKDLNTLHLCHGNFYSSPNNDVNEKDLVHLAGLRNIKQVHLEGFDCLSQVGLKPFATMPAASSVNRLVLKHCQDMQEDVLPSIGRMEQLTSLHIVHSENDEVPIFDEECLRHLNELSELKSLSLFYVLEDASDLKALWGLSSLETLNIALEDELDGEQVEHFCRDILPMFGSLKKLRIFSEDGGMDYSFRRGNLEVEYAPFSFGDLVYLE